jgi:hypothetical protein
MALLTNCTENERLWRLGVRGKLTTRQRDELCLAHARETIRRSNQEALHAER